MEILRMPGIRDIIIFPLQVVAILLIALSLVALGRTRKLPRTTKCLNIGLLLFDFLVTSCYILVTFLNENSQVFTVILKCAAVIITLSHLTVTMMAVDRLIAINWPNKYLQLLIKRQPWKYIVFIWIFVFLLLHLHLLVLCYNMPVLNVKIYSDPCTVVYSVLIGLLFILNVLVPFLCYVIIFIIIRNQSLRMRVRTRTFFHHYKSTSVVLLYMINIIVTTILYSILFFNALSPRLRIYYSSLIYLMNGLVDTCSYVLWFKECRLELLKIVVTCFPRARPYIEPMKIKVYNICTMRNS